MRIPVSYTHLDVYKRQAVSCEITKEEAEAAGYGQEDGWCVIIPVSGSPDLGLSLSLIHIFS